MAVVEWRHRELVGIAPFSFVADVLEAAAYYRDVLGFSYDRMWGRAAELLHALPRRPS
jgi:hypothetical protein